MEIKVLKISEIFPDEDQPRKFFDEESLERLVLSITENGIEQPILVRKTGVVYTIIDGERRWRASNKAGLKELPCIISDNPEILEQQLRTDCLKEGLSVDELDKAIYRYYEHRTSTKLPSNKQGIDQGHSEIARKIGKSERRVKIAIDRFEFKKENQGFVQHIEKKYNPENKRFNKVDSTIAMTDKLKNKPEIRKAVVEKILEDRKNQKFGIDNETIKNKINTIAQKAEKENFNAQDAVVVLDTMSNKETPIQLLKSDPRYLFQKQYFEFCKFYDYFIDYEFADVAEHIQGEIMDKFKNKVKELLNYLEKTGEIK